MGEPPKIALLLADVDGTLVTPGKVLTARARKAVNFLHRACIRFAITSGRPPKGMAMLVEPLAIDMPIAGFNGGILCIPISPSSRSASLRRMWQRRLRSHHGTWARRVGLFR